MAENTVYRIVTVYPTGERIPMKKVVYLTYAEAERWLRAVEYAGIIPNATYEIVEESGN